MIKKIYVFILISFFYSNTSYSQNLKNVDLKIIKYPTSFNNPNKLADRIAKDYDTDIERVRAIYTWITNNVAYNYSESGKYIYSYTDANDHIKKEREYRNKLSKRVVSKGVAVCEGYSTLFNELCNLLKIKSWIVNGDSKTRIKDIGKRFSINHAWNIAEINGENYLFDSTWGAGVYNKVFEKDVTYNYFMTKPEIFIKKHYPKDYKNTLLDYKIDKNAFLNAPLLFDIGITGYKLIAPTHGVLSKSNKGKTKFIIKTDIKNFSIGYQVGRTHNYINTFTYEKGYLKFELDLYEVKGKDLIIYINNYAFLGFKLK